MGPKPPAQFDFTRPESWPEWKQRYVRYHRISKTDKESEEFQIDSLLYIMGDTADKIIKLFPAEKKTKYADILTEMDAYFQPKSNVAHSIVKFNSRQQMVTESNEAYIRELNTMIDNCNFGDQKDTNLKYRLLTGMKDKQLSLELQQLSEGELTLTVVINRMRAKENIVSSQNEMTTRETEIAAISKPAMHRQAAAKQNNYTANRQQQHYGAKPRTYTRENINCTRCGSTHPRRQCPAYGKKCLNCQKLNHFQKVCRAKQKYRAESSNAVHEATTENADDYADGFDIGTVDSIDNACKSVWYIDICIENTIVKAKVDTGAQVNVLSNVDYQELSRNVTLLPAKSTLTAYNGSPIPTIGMVDVDFTCKQGKHKAQFYVSENHSSCSLIGLNTVRDIGLLSVDSVHGECTSLLSQFSNQFEGLGKIMGYEHSITVDPSVVPVACASRKIPIHIQPKLKTELERLEKLDIVEKCSKPTDWVSPIAIVPKPNNEIRVCLDPLYLNKAIQRERYELPTSQEIFSRIGNSKIFSVVDARNGFHQIALSEESQLLTTFITPFGRYVYKRLPFGLTSSAEIFHKTMVDKLQGLDGIEIYIDDILVHAETKAEHDIRLKNLLVRCKEINLKLNKEKSQICQSSVKFLGHVVTDSGLAPTRDRAHAIASMSSPTSKTEVMRFLGMVNYVAKFCKEMASKTEPLRNLIRKDVDFQWDANCEKAFVDIKEMIASAPVLKRFCKADEITIQVDSSSHTMGAVIMQNNQPVEYATKPLTKTQVRYAQIEKELLAVLFGCRKFHYYVYGGKTFTVQTDHLGMQCQIQKAGYFRPKKC